MKKILFAAGITVVGLSAAFAQDVKQTTTAPTATKRIERPHTTKATPEVIAKARTNRLSKQLSLNSDQEQKVYDIFLKHAQASSGRSVQRDELDKQLQSVLTPEQNKKYDQMKEEGRKNTMERTRIPGNTLEAAPASR